MNRNVMIVLAGGFLIAVLVALLVQASLSGGREEAAPVVVAEVAKVKILAASKEIKIGDKLSEENLKWLSWPEDAVFPDAIKQTGDEKPAEAIEGRVSRAVKADEPLLRSIILTDVEEDLAAVLEKGMRAVAIGVNAESMVAGFVKPGDRVDILLTYRSSVEVESGDPYLERIVEQNLNSIATETILENVKVLAVDQRSQASIDEENLGKPKVGSHITVEATPKMAEILAVASTLGDLSLALRGIGDEMPADDQRPVTTDARITKVYDEILNELNRAEQNANQNTKVIRIYRGENVESMSVRP